METKYYGIFVEPADDGEGWFIQETGNGGDQFFPEYPTEDEIDSFREEIYKG